MGTNIGVAALLNSRLFTIPWVTGADQETVRAGEVPGRRDPSNI